MGLSIDSTPAVQASTDLDKLTVSAKKAETATEALTEATTASALEMKTAGTAIQDLSTKSLTAVQALGQAQSASARGASYLAGVASQSISSPVQQLVQAQTAAKALVAAQEEAARVAAEVAAAQQAANDALNDNTHETDRGTISAHQYNQALGLLPQRLADLVLGLTSGQSAFQVFAQQGEHITREFGGIQNTLSGLASVINPVTIAIAAVVVTAGALFEIFNKGQQDAFALQKSLTLSGDAAGVTADQLSKMADALQKVTGSRSDAVDAVTKAVSTNLIPANLIAGVSQVALQLQQTVGKAVEDTISEFASLGDQPLDAVDALQKKYNFLTLATRAQIQALQAEGNASGAAQLAESAFLDANQKRVKDLQSSMGSLQSAWKSVVDTAKSAGNAILSVGRPQSAQDQLASLQSKLTTGSLARGQGTDAEAQILQLQKQITLQQQSADEDAKRALAARNLATYEALANQGIAAQMEAINAAAGNARQALQNASQVILAQIQIQDDALEQQRNLNQIGDADYYAAKIALLQASGQAQQVELAKEAASIRKQIADNAVEYNSLRQLAHTPIEVQSIDNAEASQQTTLRAQLADIEAKRAQTAIDTSRQILGANNAEVASVLALTRSYANLVLSSNQYVESLQRQYALSVSGVGAGQQSRDRASQLAAIQDNFRQQQQQLQNSLNNGQIQQPQFDVSTQIIKDGLAKATEAFSQYYKDLDEKQGDWVNGAKEALNNYVDAAKNVANLADQAFTSAFQHMEDAIVNFATTGKFSFKDLATSILGDLVRMEVKILESQALSSIFNAFGPSAGALGATSGVGALSGSTVGFAATGGDISGPTIVGEKGPELFVPKQGGTVIPNNMLSGIGGGVSIHQEFNFSSGANVGQLQAAAEQIKQQTLLAVQDKLNRGEIRAPGR